jgi:predicted nucleotidyltransferase
MQIKEAAAWRSNDAWERKLAADVSRAHSNLTERIDQTTDIVLKRARALGAQSVILTGSTVRGRRTTISDLDYLIVGDRPRVTDLAEDVDIHVASPERFFERLRCGDSFTHWTVDHGCVLWDSGVFREGLIASIEEDLSPDPDRLRTQFDRALRIAERVIESGDDDASLVETRSAVSLGARWWLLAQGTSPLARSELPAQLRAVGDSALASCLVGLIWSQPSLDDLRLAVGIAKNLRQRVET